MFYNKFKAWQKNMAYYIFFLEYIFIFYFFEKGMTRATASHDAYIQCYIFIEDRKNVESLHWLKATNPKPDQSTLEDLWTMDRPKHSPTWHHWLYWFIWQDGLVTLIRSAEKNQCQVSLDTTHCIRMYSIVSSSCSLRRDINILTQPWRNIAIHTTCKPNVVQNNTKTVCSMAASFFF